MDALADALAECASARWHPEARKLLVVTGDSPGYSILNPAPWGANAAVREKDVETVALDLHRKGVEGSSVRLPACQGFWRRPVPRSQSFSEEGPMTRPACAVGPVLDRGQT